MDLEQLNLKHYREALGGVGPQAAQWADKPHRLVYDLCSEIERLRAQTEDKGNSVKLEQLENGNWLINGVEYAPVENEKDLLLRSLQAESEGWEVFFGNREQPDQRYEYQIYLPSFSQWSLRSNETKPLDETHHKTIYRRRLRQPRKLPVQPIDPDQLPVRVTMRNGQHYTAVGLSRSGKGVVCVEPQKSGHWIVVNVAGHFNTEKQPVGRDIIHVGKWLSTEELEAKRNES